MTDPIATGVYTQPPVTVYQEQPAQLGPIVHPKTAGAAVGTVSGSTLALVVVWVLGLTHVNVTPEVAAALAAILSTFLGVAGAYLKPILTAEQANLVK